MCVCDCVGVCTCVGACDCVYVFVCVYISKCVCAFVCMWVCTVQICVKLSKACLPLLGNCIFAYERYKSHLIIIHVSCVSAGNNII